MLIGGSVYTCIHDLPYRFLFKLINMNLIWKETRRAEHEYINIHPPNQRSSNGFDCYHLQLIGEP